MTQSVHVGEPSVGRGVQYVGHIDTYVEESEIIELVFDDGVISPYSQVFASATEIQDEEPFIGATILTVHNVTPMSNTLVLRLGVEPNWGHHVRLYYLIAN